MNSISRTILATSLVTGLLLASSPVTAQEEGNTLEGFKVTGLPLVSFSTDDGFGYGLRIFGTNYVEGVDPFDYQMYVQYYKTTLGFEYHEVALDTLNFLGTPYRVKFNAGFARTLNAQWYGRGNFHDLQKEQKIKNGELPTGENIPEVADIPIRKDQKDIPEGWEWVRSFDSPYLTLNRKAVDNFQDFLEREPQRHKTSDIVNTKGREYYRQTQNKFYNYDRIRPFATASTEQFIGSSNFKYFLGFRGQRYRIQSYKNDIDSGDRLPNNQTLIDLERPTGYDATEKERFVNGVRGAIAYDSRPREREKNPNTGIFADLHVEGVGKGTGSHYTFTRVTATWRHYIDIFPSLFNPAGELVFAYRIQGQETFGDVPFFEAGRIYTMDEANEGIGTNRGVRGYAANQFVDTVMGMVNTELRWTFAKTGFLGGMDFVMLAYYDTGRVADKWENMTSDGMHNAVGGGIRMVWQKNTIVNISYGRSKYGVNGNFSFNHMF